MDDLVALVLALLDRLARLGRRRFVVRELPDGGRARHGGAGLFLEELVEVLFLREKEPNDVLQSHLAGNLTHPPATQWGVQVTGR